MDAATTGLLSFLGVGCGVLLAALLAFEVLRRVTPGTYYFREMAASRREWDDYNGAPIHAPPRPAARPLAWLLPTLRHPLDDVVRTHGLDAALYLRFLRVMTTFFAALALLLAPVLMPVYGTGVLKNAPGPEKVEGIAIISLANVPQEDWARLSVALSCEVLIIAAIAYLMRRELTYYVHQRLKYRSDSTRNPANYAVVVLDIPEERRSTQKIADFFERCFPGDVAAVHHVRRAGKLAKAKGRLLAAIKAREVADWCMIRACAVKPQLDHSKLQQKATAAMEKQRSCEENLRDLTADLDAHAPHTHAAVVIFKNKRSAMLAASAPLWNKASEWRVERAAEPRAVAWSKLGMNKHVAFVISVVATVALAAFSIFWFIPIAFLQGLANIKGLSEMPIFAFLRGWVNSRDPRAMRLLAFVEGVLPQIVLTVFLLLVPIIIRLVVGFERIPHKGRFEARVRRMLSVFLIVSNFLFVVLAGAVLEKLNEIVANPTLQVVVDILGTTVPAQATFLMGYILFNSFVGGPVALLNLGRLFMRPVLSKLGARTKRKVLAADANGVEFPFYQQYAQLEMIAFIAIIYSNIAPLIMIVAAIYCAISYTSHKFLLLHSMVPHFETGGQLYSGAWYTILCGLYVHQLSLVGVFALKKSPTHSTAMLVIFFASLSLLFYFRQTFARISELGSLVDQMDADKASGVVDKVRPEFVERYVDPALKPLEPWEVADLTGTLAEVLGKSDEPTDDADLVELGSAKQRTTDITD